VVAVRICRVSGKLASDGCDHVQVVTESGEVQTQSMLYTEYFSRGTEPTEYCPLHAGPQFDRLAGILVGQLPPAAPEPNAGRPSAIGRIATAAGQSSDGTSRSGSREPPEKKRGFWARLFGVGKDAEKDSQDRNNGRKKDEKD
jgi:hypothetical protein